jgi:hypothetical protein
MRKANAGKGNEKQLFHGTDSKHVDAICLQNIAWRMGGTQGTPYGQGEFYISCDIYISLYNDLLCYVEMAYFFAILFHVTLWKYRGKVDKTNVFLMSHSL